eukprot:UN2553
MSAPRVPNSMPRTGKGSSAETARPPGILHVSLFRSGMEPRSPRPSALPPVRAGKPGGRRGSKEALPSHTAPSTSVNGVTDLVRDALLPIQAVDLAMGRSEMVGEPLNLSDSQGP